MLDSQHAKTHYAVEEIVQTVKKHTTDIPTGLRLLAAAKTILRGGDSMEPECFTSMDYLAPAGTKSESVEPNEIV